LRITFLIQRLAVTDMHWARYYNFVIDKFGADRCMWESNFPPDRASCSYTVLWNAFKRISKGRGCSDEEMAALFGGTAKRVYKLDESKL